MSEDVPSYHVKDYCGVCGALLQPAPLGGRYACHPEAERADGHWSQMYWSEAVPLPADLRGYLRLRGRDQRMQTEHYVDGVRIEHRPLFLYRSMSS